MNGSLPCSVGIDAISLAPPVTNSWFAHFQRQRLLSIDQIRHSQTGERGAGIGHRINRLTREFERYGRSFDG
jgi:hypothetical protein